MTYNSLTTFEVTRLSTIGIFTHESDKAWKKRKRKPKGRNLDEGLSEPCSKKEIRSVIPRGERHSETISRSLMAVRRHMRTSVMEGRVPEMR